MGNSEWLRRTAEAQYNTTSHGQFVIAVYEALDKEHLILIKGDVKGKEDVPVRVQSECLPGTALDSADCDCREQLQGSLGIISQSSMGAILYMREEGRGHGLAIKIRALANKNAGLDTFEAVRALGLPPDIRDYKDTAAIIMDLGIASIQLITNNPSKIAGLEKEGVMITGRIPIEVLATESTRPHLIAKKAAGHFLTQSL